MMGKLLPATDGGVAVQAVLAALILSAALVSVRRNREMRLLVIGLMTRLPFIPGEGSGDVGSPFAWCKARVGAAMMRRLG